MVSRNSRAGATRALDGDGVSSLHTGVKLDPILFHFGRSPSRRSVNIHVALIIEVAWPTGSSVLVCKLVVDTRISFLSNVTTIYKEN